MFAKRAQEFFKVLNMFLRVKNLLIIIVRSLFYGQEGLTCYHPNRLSNLKIEQKLLGQIFHIIINKDNHTKIITKFDLSKHE